MALCSYVERRRQTYYFRLRLPAGTDTLLGRTHLVASLGTRDPRTAKTRAARFYFVVAGFLTTLGLGMIDSNHIEGQDDGAAAALARAAFKLGCQYEADAKALYQHYSAALRKLVVSVQQEWHDDRSTCSDGSTLVAAVAVPIIDKSKASLQSGARLGVDATAKGCEMPDAIRATAGNNVLVKDFKVNLPWHSHLDAFYADKPGLTEKTLWSYNQAFTAWRSLIGETPTSAIRRPDVKRYADYLRDKPNMRGGQLHHKSILRSLGHIKNFMTWAVAAGLADDDRFETVQARSTTGAERLSGPPRRAFTDVELDRLFHSRLFVWPKGREDRAAAMFLAVAALTGARTDELANAPARFARLGDIDCLDLRAAGTKTSAAPRLIPLLPDLIRMGLPAWAAEQQKCGYTLFQPGPKPLTSSVWSKRFARYIGETISEDPTLVLYSLRHSFRQMLRAAAIGEELADKIFGHTSDRVGANYGRTLSSQEAALFIERVRPPIGLDHLWRTGS